MNQSTSQLQEQINEFYATKWFSNRKFLHSGYTLVDEICDGETVLDVGCGNNLFRAKIDGLLGIDPVNSNAHVRTTIEEFRTNVKFDVAFCLGSINLGPEEMIKQQIGAVLSHLTDKGRIYWRCNPGIKDHVYSECPVDIYGWSVSKHKELAEEFNCIVTDIRWDDHHRIYAQWLKKM